MELKTNQQPQERKQPKKSRVCRKFKKSCKTLFLTVVLGISIWGGIESYKEYQNPSIEGRWVSDETGKTIEFTESGEVKVDKVQTGTYLINAPDMMAYHIEGHEFNMYYELNKRNLTWGVIGEEEELFKRK